MRLERSEEYRAGEIFFKALKQEVQLALRDSVDARTFDGLNTLLKGINTDLGRNNRSPISLNELVEGLERRKDHPETKISNMTALREREELGAILDKYAVPYVPSDVDHLDTFLLQQRIESMGRGKAQ